MVAIGVFDPLDGELRPDELLGMLSSAALVRVIGRWNRPLAGPGDCDGTRARPTPEEPLFMFTSHDSPRLLMAPNLFTASENLLI